MDFGKTDDLSKVDFTLPTDRPQTLRLLDELSKNKPKNPGFFVGCAKWGRKDWIGQIYPEGTKEKDFFNIYARNFNSIELNATHYGIPTAKTVQNWKSHVEKKFRFCPKFPQSISHFKRLKGAYDTTMSFYDAIKLFDENLGTSFLQLPPNFSPKSVHDFEKYIADLPKDLKVCVEFRHPDWFTESREANEAFEAMRENGIGTVITDAAGRRDCVHQLLTTGEAFIRFVGNGLHPTDYTRTDDWVHRLKKWTDDGVAQVYYFMHQHDERYSPILIDYAIREINKVCHTKVQEPHILEKAKDLFA